MTRHVPFDANSDWTNPYCDNTSNDPLVDKLIGNAYHVVRTVYCNLGNLKLIYDFLNQYGMVLGVKSEAELKALTVKASFVRLYGFDNTNKRIVTDYLYVEGDRTGIIPDDPAATGSWILVATSNSGGGGDGKTTPPYIPYVYNNGSALGGETTILVPADTVGVPMIVVEGYTNFVGYGFSYDQNTLTVTLAQPLEPGDEVVLMLTGTPAVPNNPNVSDWIQINWLYNGGNAVGGEQVIFIPYTFQSVPAIYKNGARYYAGLVDKSYTVDVANQRILLTEPLATNDRLIVTVGGEATTIIMSDRSIQEIARSANVKDSEVILSTDTTQVLNGKKVIYDVVSQRIYGLPTLPTNVYINTVSEGQLTYSPGNITVTLQLIGAAESFAALKNIVPEHEGQVVSLRSHQAGWAVQARTPVGGGEFVAIAGSAVDDGGYICVPEGQSNFYWMRVLDSNEYLTPQMYGYITGYSDSTETGMELKPYVQAAIDTSIAIGKSKVLLPDGDYYTAIGNIELAGTGRNRSAGVLVFGGNPAHTKMGTRIYFDAPELTSPLFVSRSPSSVHTGQHIDDLWLGTPTSKRYRGIALQLVGTCHMLSQRVHVERLYDGINFLNTRALDTDNSEGDENGYCEFDTFRDWTINKCVNAISFNNDGTGDPSLHGVAFKNFVIQLKEDGNGLYFKGAKGGLMWYGSPDNTIKFWGGADDTTTCQLICLESTEVRGVSGQMTWEGRGRISCDQYSWWRFNGDIFGIPSSLAMIDYSGVVSEHYLGDARVAFNNTTSKDRVAMSNPVMSGFYMRPIMPFSRAAKRTRDIPVAMPIRITSSPLEFPTDTSNYEGIAFPTFHNGEVWFGEVVNRSVWSAMIPSMKITSSNGAISNYYGSGMMLYNFTANGVALSNPGWMFGNSIYPLSPEGGGVGTDSNRVSALYTKSVQITASGIFPRTNKGANIGNPGGSFNNIYLENSPIITSDKKDKYGYVGLSEEEIKCAIACAKLYRRYQMKESVIKKGEDQARFHIGVIAQDLVECFTQHGLDWTRYGIFIYQKVESRPAVIESWEDEWIDILEEKDDDGNIIKEASRHLRRAAGSITLEPAVEAGEYYKLRYDELNCFINAGFCARLEALEDKLS